MRTAFLLAIGLLVVGRLSAKLDPGTTTSAYHHLAEVNERWLYEVGPAAYLSERCFDDEAARIRYHLLEVHRALTARPVDGLSAAQALARRQSLDELNAYALRGRFPINTAHPARTPYFVDADGTHCAVGFLMHRAGGDALVGEIGRRTNNGYVLRDLLDYPAVGAWARAHGFTAEELAWIQPGYSASYLLNPRPFGRGLGVRGGRVLAAAATSDDGIFLAGDFSELDGTSAGGMVRVDGIDVTAVANDFTSIRQLEYLRKSNSLVCVGPAGAPGRASTRIGIYDVASGTFVGSWEFDGDQSVYVHADSLREPLLFVGAMRGPLDSLNVYSLAVEDRELTRLAPDHDLTGVIYDSYYFDGAVMLGGECRVRSKGSGTLVDSNQVRFEVASREVLPDNNRLVEHASNLLTKSNLPVFRFYAVDLYKFRTGSHLTGASLTIDRSTSTLLMQTFEVKEGTFEPIYESRHATEGFKFGAALSELSVFAEDGIILSGQVAAPTTNLDPADDTKLIAQSTGLMFFYTQEVPIDGRIAAAVQIGDSLLLAGDFASIAGVPVQQLAYARPEVSDVPDERPINVGAYVANQQLHLTLDEEVVGEAKIFLYRSDGRLFQSAPLPAGESAFTIPLPGTTSEVVYFAVSTARGLGTGSVLSSN